jgi:toxin ParE1/3/4
MPGYRVTPRALEDLKNIGRYTEQQSGRHQRNSYLKALEKRFGAENPKSGKHRKDVAEGSQFPPG